MGEQEKVENEKVRVEPSYRSARSERAQRRAARRADRRGGGLGWLAGLLLIGLGALFLLQNEGFLTQFSNWWALFLLLPAIGTLSAALGAYRRNGGHWTAEVTGPFLGGLLFLGLTTVFLLELNYTWLWSLFLIAAGLLLMATTLLGRSSA
jgi:hypothetical protein